ncbi:MAG: MATE family efflux transporter [Acholeplasmatales bacterium]|nr:MATE family efflux transporter [Acholeplasmatales bacterium]
MATKDLSVGKPWKVILLFALPMILSVTLQQVYNLADSMIAGRIIGGNALGAISASYPITMIYLGLATGSGVGTGVVVSRFFGMKKMKEVKTGIYTAIITFGLLAILLALIGSFISKPLLKAINTDSIILNDASTYLVFYSVGMVFLFLYNVTTYIFQALGNSKTPLYFLAFSTTLNIILDIIFAKNNMGVFGIALATFIAQGIASIAALSWLLITLRKLESEKPNIYSFQLIKLILLIAIPSMIQSSIVAIGGVLVQGEINTYGGEVTAGYGAAYKLCYIVINIIFTMSNALSSYTSQNIGAGHMERVKPGLRATFLISLIIALASTAIFVPLSKELVRLFLDKNAIDATLNIDNITNVGARFLLIVTPFYFLVSVKISFDGVLKGAGDMRHFMIGTFLDLIIRVEFTFLLSIYIGLEGIWWAWPIGWIFGSSAVVAFYFMKRWKKINEGEPII